MHMQRLLLALLVALFSFMALPSATAFDYPTPSSTVCGVRPYYWGGNDNAHESYLMLSGNICTPPIAPVNEVCTACKATALPACFCQPGLACLPGPDYPACKRCPKGYYCPYAGNFEPIPCEAGYFCPEGSIYQRKCRPMDYCPEKSHSYVYLGGLVTDFIVLVSLYAIIQLWKKMNKPKNPESIFVRRTVNPEVADQGGDGEGVRKPNFMTFDLKFVDLGFTLKISKGLIKKTVRSIPILAGVSGELPHGKVTAIMGPSGAGKTTFLNVLCGKVTRSSGKVYINGKEDEIERYTKVIGFVPQDDVMLRTLTVEEVLIHSARVRLPNTTTWDQIHQKVNEVIQILGLQECRNTIIGDELKRGISGGQRKRVNIGMELVMNPSLLFLDEPTSGLDSSSAEECVRALKTIAGMGINVIAVIHQPRVEIFRMFDTLLLLGKGGRTVYLGPPMDGIDHFTSLGYEVEENVNAPDWYLDITSGMVKNTKNPNADTSSLFDEWDKLHPYEKPAAAPADGRRFTVANSKAYLSQKLSGDISRRTPSLVTQVYYFMRRAIIQTRHSYGRFCLDCFLFAFTGLYLGLAFVKPKMRLPIPIELRADCPTAVLQIPAHLSLLDKEAGGVRDFCGICTPLEDRVGLMFFYMAMGVGLISAAVSVRTFGSELEVYWREAASGIKTVAYFLGMCIVDAVKILVYTNFYMSTFYLLAAPLSDPTKFYWLTYLLIFAVFGVGYCSSVWLSKENAGFVAVIVGSVWSLTTGVVFSTTTMSFIGWLSFPMWFGEASYSIETDTIPYPNMDLYADLVMGYDLHRLFTDYVMIAFLGILLRVLAFIGLRYTHRDKQR